MKISKMRISTFAAILAVASIVSGAWAQEASQQARLTVKKNKVVNGIEAELRGDYRASSSPTRLNSQLEDVNIPVGTKVAFCLVQNGASTLLGVGKVVLVGGLPTATVELSANDGDFVPTVKSGDVLQARQKTAAPFNSNPTCTSALMISGSFR